MKYQFKKGETSVMVHVFIQDSSSTSGAGLAGLDQTSSITGGYVRQNSVGLALAVDENVATEGTYAAPSTDNQVRIGTPANMIDGVYELHFHDDLFAAGGPDYVTISLGGASNMAPLLLEIQLTVFDLNASVTQTGDSFARIGANGAGLTSINLPNQTMDITGSITGNLIGDVTGNVDGTVTGKTPAEAGDAMNLAADAIKAVSYDESTAFPLTAVNGSTLTEAGGDGDHLTAINLPNQTMDIVGNITGNLSGTVGTVNAMANNVITAASINADAITNAKIADDAIGAENLATDAISADALSSGAVDEMWAKAMSDLAQGAPSATASALTALNYLYEAWRNKTTATATLITVMKDDGTTALVKATIGDVTGTFTKAEMISGA